MRLLDKADLMSLLERHYIKLTASMGADRLAGLTFGYAWWCEGRVESGGSCEVSVLSDTSQSGADFAWALALHRVNPRRFRCSLACVFTPPRSPLVGLDRRGFNAHRADNCGVVAYSFESSYQVEPWLPGVQLARSQDQYDA